MQRNIPERLERAREKEKSLAYEIRLIEQDYNGLDRKDPEIKEFLEAQEKRIERLELRKAQLTKAIQNLVQKGHATGWNVQGYIFRQKDVMPEKSIDYESVNGKSMKDTLSDEDIDSNEKGRKVRLPFEELKNLLRVTLPPETWAKCITINDYLVFSNRKQTHSKNLSKQRRNAILQIIAETKGNMKEVRRLESEINLAQVKHRNAMRKARKTHA